MCFLMRVVEAAFILFLEHNRNSEFEKTKLNVIFFKIIVALIILFWSSIKEM